MKRRSIFRQARLDAATLKRRTVKLEKRIQRLMTNLVDMNKLVASLEQVPTGGK